MVHETNNFNNRIIIMVIVKTAKISSNEFIIYGKETTEKQHIGKIIYFHIECRTVDDTYTNKIYSFLAGYSNTYF